MKDDFKYTFTTDDNAQQEEEYEKMLEKDIESQCVYVDKLEIVNEFTDEELRSTKSVDEVIEYKNAQIIKLKAYIASLEQEKQDLINNYKKTTDQLLDKVKEYEYKQKGFRPETPFITKQLLDKRNKNNKSTGATSATTHNKQRCPNCAKEFPNDEFIAHSLNCLRKSFRCKQCNDLIDESSQRSHIEHYTSITTLQQALNTNDISLFTKCIQHDCDVSTLSNTTSRDSILHILCKDNKHKQLRVLFDYNPKLNVNTINNNKDSPLITAITNSSDECARILLSKGADVKLRNKSDMSPLMLACKYGNIPIVKELLKYKADINEKNILGDTPLKIAQMHNHDNLAMMLLNEFNVNLKFSK